jgi:hypothetical protein
LAATVGELLELSRTIFGTKEAVLPGVATHDVIQTAGHMKTRPADRALTKEQRTLCN